MTRVNRYRRFVKYLMIWHHRCYFRAVWYLRTHLDVLFGQKVYAFVFQNVDRVKKYLGLGLEWNRTWGRLCPSGTFFFFFKWTNMSVCAFGFLYKVGLCVWASAKVLLWWFGSRWCRLAICRDHSCSEQHDDEHDDGNNHDHHHDQLHVLPPVGACHLLRRVLEVLRLRRNTVIKTPGTSLNLQDRRLPFVNLM